MATSWASVCCASIVSFSYVFFFNFFYKIYTLFANHSGFFYCQMLYQTPVVSCQWCKVIQNKKVTWSLYKYALYSYYHFVLFQQIQSYNASKQTVLLSHHVYVTSVSCSWDRTFDLWSNDGFKKFILRIKLELLASWYAKFMTTSQHYFDNRSNNIYSVNDQC